MCHNSWTTCRIEFRLGRQHLSHEWWRHQKWAGPDDVVSGFRLYIITGEPLVGLGSNFAGSKILANGAFERRVMTSSKVGVADDVVVWIRLHILYIITRKPHAGWSSNFSSSKIVVYCVFEPCATFDDVIKSVVAWWRHQWILAVYRNSGTTCRIDFKLGWQQESGYLRIWGTKDDVIKSGLGLMTSSVDFGYIW